MLHPAISENNSQIKIYLFRLYGISKVFRL
nr:MAG TPA: hypothetical protein [Caudoviricetes sp.]